MVRKSNKDMLNRKIYSYLRNFFVTEKKALLISGARQVGKTFAIPRAIVFSNGNVQVVGKILYYPIYMLMYLQPEMIKKPIFRFEPI